MKGFRVECQFPHYTNPPHFKDKIEDRMKNEYFKQHGFEFYFSPFGGMLYTCVVLYKNHSDLDEKDRLHLAHWLKKQRMRCDVLIGELEETDTLDINSDYNGNRFSVDNLTDQDRIEADSYHQKILRMLQ